MKEVVVQCTLHLPSYPLSGSSSAVVVASLGFVHIGITDTGTTGDMSSNSLRRGRQRVCVHLGPYYLPVGVRTDLLSTSVGVPSYSGRS